MREFKKYVPPFEALEKVKNYCAIQERSQKAVREKLLSWGLKSAEVESIIAELIMHGFLSEQRFADAFASGRSRIKGWGRRKIAQHLKFLGVSEPCIDKALSKIDAQEYHDRLFGLIKKRAALEKGRPQFEKRGRIAKFLINKGYEPELVWNIISDLSD